MTLLVVDVEATCWPDDQPALRQRQREISEIIEIGAVRLEGPSLQETGEYQAFLRPETHPELSEFCCSLTSIRQQDVADAPTFVDGMQAFLDWIGEPETLVMASWSAYDQQLFKRQCAENDLPPPPWKHIDLKAEFGRWIFAQDGTRTRFRLAKALEHVGVDVTGTAHRALDDARNTASLLRIIRAPENTSPLTRHVMRLMQERGERGTHLGHTRGLLPNPKSWFPRVRHELLRCRLARDLGDGKGLVFTPYGEQAAERLGLDDLPPPVDPSVPVTNG